ncbi:hypothetical protein ACCS96_17960, partial [Rhizobium ruizarguesonis]
MSIVTSALVAEATRESQISSRSRNISPLRPGSQFLSHHRVITTGLNDGPPERALESDGVSRRIHNQSLDPVL